MVSPVKERVLIQRLREFGFEGPVKQGVGKHARKHPFMTKGEQHLFLPNHHGSRKGELGIELVRHILKEAGISPQEWDARK